VVTLNEEFAELYDRDLRRLIQQIEAFPSDALVWETRPGLANSAGNLALHLEGNLREFLGRQLGGIPFVRQRDLEFSAKGVTRAELVFRLESVRQLLREVFAAGHSLDADSGETRFGISMTWRQFALHLYAHFSYHLGQIDARRRLLTEDAAIPYVNIER
jgi:hypothetical protein